MVKASGESMCPVIGQCVRCGWSMCPMWLVNASGTNDVVIRLSDPISNAENNRPIGLRVKKILPSYAILIKVSCRNHIMVLCPMSEKISKLFQSKRKFCHV